jgi:hypothetical protein
MKFPNLAKQSLGIFTKVSFVVKWVPRMFMLAGILFIVIGSKNIYQAYESSSWPYVQGRIISSEIKSHSRTYTNTTTNSEESETVYDAHINYDYVINGIAYSNDDVKIGGIIKTNTTIWARKLLDKYPQGKVVNVYYKPEDPSQSVLEKGLQLSTWSFSALGFAIFIFGIYFKKAFLNMGRMVFGYKTEPEVTSTTRLSMSSSATDPRLLGKWELVDQTPSYEELAEYSMKQFNFSAEEFSPENVIVPKGKTIVTITENKIYFKMQGANLFSDVGHEYTLQHDRLVLAPVKSNMFIKAMTSLTPTYYRFTFSDSKLILTSDKIRGYDNQSITYNLERA